MDPIAGKTPREIAAHERERNGTVVAIGPHVQLAPTGPRFTLKERRAMREVRIQPEQLEALSAVVYTALDSYGSRCCGEAPWPDWNCAPDATRRRWMLNVEKALGGFRLPSAQLGAMELFEVRRVRLMNAVVVALTAVA